MTTPTGQYTPPATEPRYHPPAWGGSSLFDLTVPSGGTCQVRRLQMEDIVELGLLDQLDVLGVATQHDVIDPVRRPADHQSRQPTKAETQAASDTANQQMVDELFSDPAKFRTMSGLIDKVCFAAVVQPRLTLPYRDTDDGQRVKLDEGERNPDLTYVDSVPFGDKMAIFEECFGGLDRLTQFRDEPDADVAAVAGGDGDERATESPVGAG